MAKTKEYDGMAYVMCMLFKGDFEAAYPALKKASDAGIAEANYYLGKMYLYGDYVQQSDNSAFHLIKKAANKNNIDAQCLLAQMLTQGIGTEKSIESAVDYLTRSAESGSADAAILLARSYITGNGVEINYRTALYWARSNKPLTPLWFDRMRHRHIDRQVEVREFQRFSLLCRLYISMFWWKLVKPIIR